MQKSFRWCYVDREIARIGEQGIALLATPRLRGRLEIWLDCEPLIAVLVAKVLANLDTFVSSLTRGVARSRNENLNLRNAEKPCVTRQTIRTLTSKENQNLIWVLLARAMM
jgi:hypothetical protein